MAYRMLIVDDSNVIRRKIERGSDPTKFQIIGTATNGVDAIAKAKEMKPQVVTMDLTMPQMDGIQCIAALVRQDPQIQILVISALSDKATGIEALEKGARGFLCKPFDDQQLDTALKELVGEANV